MTGSTAKILTSGERALVYVARKSAKMLDFRRISVCWGLSNRCIGCADSQTC